MDEHVAARLTDREYYSRSAADLMQQLAETALRRKKLGSNFRTQFIQEKFLNLIWKVLDDPRDGKFVRLRTYRLVLCHSCR